MDKYLTRLLQLASENPEYKALADYLMSRRSYPEIQYKRDFSNTYGAFEYPGLFSDMQKRGVVKLNADPAITGAEYVAPTLTHELTHATKNQLVKQYLEIRKKSNKTDLEKQFIDSFQKIMGENAMGIAKQIQQMSPEFAKKESDYRATSTEGLAFALQNSAYPKYPLARNAPPHVDPTIATQLMLLLEQAQKVQNQQPQSQGR